MPDQWRRVGDVGQNRGMENDDNDFLEGRSRARGETTPGTIPTDQLSKLEGDAKAYVLGNGQKTGYEYLVAFDLQTGKRIKQGTSHDPGRVYIADELTEWADDPTRQLAYHHNHPDGFSLSAGDLRVMSKRPGLYEVIAYGHDGSWFRARRTSQSYALAFMLDAAKIELRHQGQWAAQRGLSLKGLEAHLVNLALDQAGLMDYAFVLDSVRAAFYQHEHAAFNQIVEALVNRIKKMRALP